MTATEIITWAETWGFQGVYEKNREQAATLLVLAGFPDGNYLTQWASGTTAWQVQDFDVTITPTGKITGLPPVQEPVCEYSHEYLNDGKTIVAKFTLSSSVSVIDGLIYKAIYRWGFITVLKAMCRACTVRRETNAHENMPQYARSYQAAETALNALYTDLAARNYE